ncbi:disulfide bond formation protein B [Acetobacteraceae bacterium]|nr:disulfide bond formation protein B [Acetobacteraceae bacterium]
MTFSFKPLSSPFFLGIFFLLAGIFAFGTAQFLQHVLYLVPCELCYLERKPWIVLSLTGLLILFFKDRGFPFFVTLGCLTLVASLGLGFLHIGVEQGWWESPFASCSAQTSLYTHTHLNLIKDLPDLPAKPCDTPDYLFGLPLTLWGFIYSLLTLLGTFLLIFAKSHFNNEK